MMGGFYAIAKVMLNQASKDRDADRAERNKLSDAITLMADNSGKVAQATVKSANEAKARNGHLGDLVAQGNKMTAKIVARLEKTAVIAAEDRDVLTNQSLHIKNEVGKILESRK